MALPLPKMPPKSPPRPNRPGRLGASAGSGSAAGSGSTLTRAAFLTAFGFGSADAVAGFRLTAPGFDCDGAATAGAGGGAARAASSIQPLALLFKSWIWTKPPSRPMTRNGRPAGKPYMAGAEADGLASTETGFLETRIMPAPGKSACSVCPTASPSGLALLSRIGGLFGRLSRCRCGFLRGGRPSWERTRSSLRAAARPQAQVEVRLQALQPQLARSAPAFHQSSDSRARQCPRQAPGRRRHRTRSFLERTCSASTGICARLLGP